MSDEEDKPTMPSEAPSGDLAARIRAERERSRAELDKLREDTGIRRLAQEATEGRPPGADPAYWDVDGGPEDEAPPSEHREHHAAVKPVRMHHKTQEMDKIVLRPAPPPPPDEVVGEAYRSLPAGGDRHARTALALGRRAPQGEVGHETPIDQPPLEGWVSRRVVIGIVLGGVAIAALATLALGDAPAPAPVVSAEPAVRTSAARVPAVAPSLALVAPTVSAPIVASAAPRPIESAAPLRPSGAASPPSPPRPSLAPRPSAEPRASAAAPTIATSGRIRLED